MPKPLLPIALLALITALPAQAEELEIIELEPEIPQANQISLNWDCDVLLLTTSQRYRPTSCQRDSREEDSLTELAVEKLQLESQADATARRKSRY